MRKHTLIAAALPLAAFSALAACGQSEPEVVNGMYDPSDSDQLAAEEATTEVPPMVRASRSYRCKDNSVIYVTFYTNDAQVGVTSNRDDPPTILPNAALAAADSEAGAPGEADATGDAGSADAASGPVRFTGNGDTLVGTGDTITYNGQTCNA